MRAILTGFFIFFEGIKLWLSERSLRRISLIPFFIDGIGLIAGVYLTFQLIPLVIEKILVRPEVGFQLLLYQLLVLVVSISLFFVVLFILFIFANLLALPFNDLLAERTLRLRLSFPAGPRNIKEWLLRNARNLKTTAIKTGILLVAGVVLALASLIPVAGVFAAFVGIFLLATDRLDYTFDHYHLSFRERLLFIRTHHLEMLGFTLALAGCMAVPVINILVYPGSVVGGALMVAKLGPTRSDGPRIPSN